MANITSKFETIFLSSNRIKKYLATFLTVFSFLFLVKVHAQKYIANIQKLGIKDGLSGYNANFIFQDSDGFIWIPTDNGLNKYDGSSIKSYTKEENGLCHNYVTSIMEDKNKMLWIAAGEKGGDWQYCIFDKLSEKFYSLENYLGQTIPFNAKNTHCYKYKDVFTFQEEIQYPNRHWNIYEYAGKKITKSFSINGNIDYLKDKTQEGIIKIAENRYSSFWRSHNNLYESLVLIFDGSGKVLETFKCPKDYPTILGTRVIGNENCIFCSASNGNYWYLNFHFNGNSRQKHAIRTKSEWGERIALSSDKIYVLNSDSLKIYYQNGLLESSIYLGLNLTDEYFGLPFVDRDGNIIFQNQEFIYIISLQKKLFEVELQHTNKPNRLRGIAKNEKGNLLCGTYSYLYEKKTDKNWSIANIAPHNFLGILKKDNILWMGTEDQRLCKLNTITNQMEEFLTVPYKGQKAANFIWMPFISKDGQVWVGTNNGLYYLNTKHKILVPMNDKSELSKSTIYAFHQSKAGTWLSTSSGLFLVDLKLKKVLQQYNKTKKGKNYIPAQDITHLHQDKNGIFWLATKGDGLIRWDIRTHLFKKFTQKKSGLSSNTLYAVYGDNFGNLWIPSQYGLMRFHKESEAIVTYLKEDGLPHNEFNTISHYQSADGHLYFGGQNGLIHFDPKNFESKSSSNSLVITDFIKQDLKTDSFVNFTSTFFENQTISILPGEKSVFLKFALLDYNNSKNHKYSYQIAGYDKNWNYLAQNEIKISGLPYGIFELKIRAKNGSSSSWINYPKTIKIIVIKPFYLQIWFILLMVCLGIGSVFIFIKWRLKKLEQGKRVLESIVKERTKKIENDKLLIENQAIELKSLDELKTKFFSNISHELRTPLTLILGPLSYILDNPDAWEDEAIKEQLLVMQRNGKNLMGLVEEILDLSKLEANKLDLKEEPTPIRQLIEYIFETFKPQFQLINVEADCKINLSNDDLILLVDRKKIEKVINNFLSNAIKFTNKGGKITLSLTEETNLIRISVSDTGKGVDPKDLPHIFERFYQSKLEDQMLYGGTGIGLALVSDFAKLMGGRAFAESKLGEGSLFYFEIPKKIAKTLEISIPEQDVLELEEEIVYQIGNNFTILVIEDNHEMRDFICKLLQKNYKTVLNANNGAEGLQIIQKHKKDIHLIVSDIMMPELDGLSLLKLLKMDTELFTIPVIMLTALADERDKLNALTIGVDDYLTKPFSVNELLIRTQNLLYNSYNRNQFIEKLNSDNVEIEDDETFDFDKSNLIKNSNIWVDKAQAIVKASIKNKIIDVEGLASELSISSRQLTRRITSVTGLSPAKFIRELQLQSALSELEDGTVLSIKEVCFNNGFEQVSTFSKLFKKRFAKNPSDFLKLNGTFTEKDSIT